MKIDGRFWLSKNDKSFLGSGRIELLRHIERTGSIHAAAKEMKMSYKAAWERINSMNELADEPIIERKIGGKGGGGTTLTPYAYELIETYNRLNELHRQFIERFAQAGENPERLAKILNRTFLTTSARNQIPSIIKEIKEIGINSLITMNIAGGGKITSSITSKSVKNMALGISDDVYAIIKSSDIEIFATPPAKNESLNILEGTIQNIELSSQSVEISLKVNELTSLILVVKESQAQALKIGDKAYATIHPSNIIIGS
ncbi:MAG: TOBE domain-containing protein [Sulfurimonas sp.]|jgi:molybdate transport system regulatory protein